MYNLQRTAFILCIEIYRFHAGTICLCLLMQVLHVHAAPIFYLASIFYYILYFYLFLTSTSNTNDKIPLYF